ncbi:hypothetical protein TNCV_15431 [Trichonephila clavipes]|nr:hypothetical protein TNCV_15431 [Trichonephila clavipes]
MSEADYLISKIQELQGIIEQQNQRLQHSSSITNESNWIEPPQVYRVSLKLLPFWADKLTVWFTQAEFQFALAHITSDATKFHYIVANLDSRYAAEVDDIFITPPKYRDVRKIKEPTCQPYFTLRRAASRKTFGT